MSLIINPDCDICQGHGNYFLDTNTCLECPRCNGLLNGPSTPSKPLKQASCAFLFRFRWSDNYGQGQTDWRESECIIGTFLRSAAEAESLFTKSPPSRSRDYRWEVIEIRYLGGIAILAKE